MAAGEAGNTALLRMTVCTGVGKRLHTLPSDPTLSEPQSYNQGKLSNERTNKQTNKRPVYHVGHLRTTATKENHTNNDKKPQLLITNNDASWLAFLYAQEKRSPPPPHHYLSLNREGRWDTTDGFATSFLHFSLFSTAL